MSILIRLELSAQVMSRLVFRIEDVVFAVSRGLPHVEDGVGNSGTSIDVGDAAVEIG